MTLPVLTSHYLNQLTRPEPRLPGLSTWLLNEVWTEAAFEAADCSPQAYLLNGERWMNALETLMIAAGDRLYAELAEPPPEQLGVGRFLNENRNAAVVVFDGCSLREIPRLIQLARDSGRNVRSVCCGRAALPSDTEAFVGGRLGLGLPEIGPSRLTSRAELRERGIRCFYFGNPGDHHTIDESHGSLLLWSRFPDQRYTDSTAVDETLYDALWDGLELACKRTVQAVPPDRPVVVTSDHGYVYLGAALSDPSLKDVDRPLEGKRFRTFGPDETPPEPRPGLWVDRRRGLAMLAGRCHNRLKAPSASRSVYRHGGLTLMEMLTPWVVLEPVRRQAASRTEEHEPVRPPLGPTRHGVSYEKQDRQGTGSCNRSRG